MTICASLLGFTTHARPASVRQSSFLSSCLRWVPRHARACKSRSASIPSPELVRRVIASSTLLTHYFHFLHQLIPHDFTCSPRNTPAFRRTPPQTTRLREWNYNITFDISYAYLSRTYIIFYASIKFLVNVLYLLRFAICGLYRWR